MSGNVLGLAIAPAIDDILRDGARRALQAAIEREVEEYIERNSGHLDTDGHRLVVRNGHHPARKIQSGNGPIEVRHRRRGAGILEGDQAGLSLHPAPTLLGA
jgi:hypothetical protein